MLFPRKRVDETCSQTVKPWTNRDGLQFLRRPSHASEPRRWSLAPTQTCLSALEDMDRSRMAIPTTSSCPHHATAPAAMSTSSDVETQLAQHEAHPGSV